MEILNAALALAFVLILMLGVALILKRSRVLEGRMFAPLAARMDSKQKNSGALELVDQLVLDFKTRMVVVRRGDLDYILLLGPQGTTLLDRRAVSGLAKPDGERIE